MHLSPGKKRNQLDRPHLGRTGAGNGTKGAGGHSSMNCLTWHAAIDDTSVFLRGAPFLLRNERPLNSSQDLSRFVSPLFYHGVFVIISLPLLSGVFVATIYLCDSIDNDRSPTVV